MFFALLGLIVGIAIGVTGVGGTTLMTPLLLISGVAPAIAVGSGLIFALITKVVASIFYGRRQTIHWPLVGLFCLGSIPASILTAGVLKHFSEYAEPELIIVAIGILVLVTSILLFCPLLLNRTDHHTNKIHLSLSKSILTVLFAFCIGIIVTLTSLGAGVLTMVFLFWFFHNLRVRTVIGTDLIHAIILTFVASIGHIVLLHSTDVSLIIWLLAGSIPGVYIGFLTSKLVGEKSMRRVIGVALFIIGIIILLRV